MHRFFTAYTMLSQWIDDNLELYRAELRRLLWPIFVHSYLQMVNEYFPDYAAKFFDIHGVAFSEEHEDELRSLRSVTAPEHIEQNYLARSYRENKYRLTLTKAVYFSLIQFLENKDKEGGSVINNFIQNSFHIVTVDRAEAGKDRAFAQLLARLHGSDTVPDEDEGIPGHNPGSANTAPDAPRALPRLKLGKMSEDQEMSEDVRDELEEQDLKHPPEPGQNSLMEELDQRIKREPSDDGPSRDDIPLPAPLARDVAMEVLRIKEHRDRFRIPPRSSGVGPGVSVCMYTFHNTFDSVNCLDFSGDNVYVAAGTSESYIRVWSLEGKPLPSATPGGQPVSSRRLIGHSGPVYNVSFAPAIANDDDPSDTSTKCHWLLSCSADKTVRLWLLDTWSCVVAYTGHDQPVWDVSWGPFGHYFVTASSDKTARLWTTDHVTPWRYFVGHDQDVDHVAFHPNSAYIFTGSCDKTVRMWDVSRATAVRIFTGHTGNVTALACAPDGRKLASADDAGTIILWDLATGRRMKAMRGHSRGGIWSLSWSVESSVLVSCGADHTVRVWDAVQHLEVGAPDGKGKTDGAGSKADGTGAISGIAGSKKGKVKEVTVTPDQISAFLTKKSPVYKVKFTQMNLVLAGGAYMP